MGSELIERGMDVDSVIEMVIYKGLSKDETNLLNGKNVIDAIEKLIKSLIDTEPTKKESKKKEEKREEVPA